MTLGPTGVLSHRDCKLPNDCLSIGTIKCILDTKSKDFCCFLSAIYIYFVQKKKNENVMVVGVQPPKNGTRMGIYTFD